MLNEKPDLKDKLLDAAEAVVVRQGIGNLTLDAVAAEAGFSKGGLLHHFPSKDRLIEAMVKRSADNWRSCFMSAYEQTSEGRGRMCRALMGHCLSEGWTEQLRQSSAAVFAALAENPSLIEPMREAYSDLHQLIAKDHLPSGVGELIVSAIDGLWLYWVLGLAPVDKELLSRVRLAVEDLLSTPKQSRRGRSARISKVHIKRRSGGRRL